MGPRKPFHSWPSWVLTVGAMIDKRIEVRAICDTCREWKAVNLEALAGIKGHDYSLINRRAHCTIVEGCPGRVRFHYLLGVYRPLWDEATAGRWSKQAFNERTARAAGDAAD
jgi:hypothetical protein